MLKCSVRRVSLGLRYKHLSLLFWTSCRVSELQGRERVMYRVA